MRNVFSPESWFGGHYANGLVPTYWSRSDFVMVAVGFNPRLAARKETGVASRRMKPPIPKWFSPAQGVAPRRQIP